MNQHGRNSHDEEDTSGPADRSQMRSEWGAFGDTSAGVSQWQERKHTLNKVRSWGRAYTVRITGSLSTFKRKHPAAGKTLDGTPTPEELKAAPTKELRSVRCGV